MSGKSTILGSRGSELLKFCLKITTYIDIMVKIVVDIFKQRDWREDGQSADPYMMGVQFHEILISNVWNRKRKYLEFCPSFLSVRQFNKFRGIS